MVKNLITEKYYSKGLLIRREYIIVGEREEAKCRISGRRFQTGNHSNGLTHLQRKEKPPE